MAAAFLVVPGLLVFFHRLSQPREGGPTSLPPASLPEGPTAHPSAASSIADEAERWLRSQA